MKLREIQPERRVSSGEDYRERKVAHELFTDRANRLIDGQKQLVFADEYADYTVRVDEDYQKRDIHVVVYNSDTDTFEVFEQRRDSINYYEVQGEQVLAEFVVHGHRMVHELFNRIEACS